ncbi:MAG: hypothetical protein ACRD8Z_20265, partial [Nitrososphaeraceae archaeon]
SPQAPETESHRKCKKIYGRFTRKEGGGELETTRHKEFPVTGRAGLFTKYNIRGFAPQVEYGIKFSC